MHHYCTIEIQCEAVQCMKVWQNERLMQCGEGLPDLSQVTVLVAMLKDCLLIIQLITRLFMPKLSSCSLSTSQFWCQHTEHANSIWCPFMREHITYMWMEYPRDTQLKGLSWHEIEVGAGLQNGLADMTLVKTFIEALGAEILHNNRVGPECALSCIDHVVVIWSNSYGTVELGQVKIHLVPYCK